jgi:hypothetical protein
MIDFLNTFIVLLLAAAALLGTSALLRKRVVRRTHPVPVRTRGSNHLP